MSKLDLLFYLTLFSVFLSYIVNLSYNTPFNDEAIYIVVGRLGLFAGDWFTYGAGFWMAGFPYIYPSLTALAYQIGGIIGSRLLNVIFALLAVEEIYRLTRQLRLFDPQTNQLSAIIAAGILGFSAAGTITARLATYDMPSFFLLLLSINSFLKAGYFNHGKYYFLASLTLFGSFLTKIVSAVFYPPLFLLSLLIIRNRDSAHRSLYIKYFVLPLGLGLSLYTILYSRFITTFTQTHIDQGTGGTYFDILSIIWEYTFPATVMAVILSPLLIFLKKNRQLLTLLLLSSIIPAFHLFLNRVPTLNKHLYLTTAFLSVIIGYGLGWLATHTRTRFIFRIAIPIVFIAYFILSRPAITNFERSWQNTAELTSFLNGRVKPGNRILTEDGSAVVLALYDKIYPPTHTATFDWIDYSGYQGEEGYKKAIQDQYFDYVELDNEHGNSELNSLIHFYLTANYSLIHSRDGFDIYAKIN